MGDIAIRVENLSKYYKLGVINSGTLSRDLQSWLWKRLGKEDPNKRIGTEEGNLAGFWALKDLNFEIKKGDRVGIIGKNGAGKSTLLKMISQISAPTEGKIYIDGKIASLLEVGTGFNPELTGRENIYLNGAILGMKKKEVDRKLDEIIAFSEIERHIDTPVKRYSSGMYVRLAFAVAAHLESDILIADEVLAVGDAAFQKKALGKMNELSTGQGRTVLFVSHNISQVKSLCSKGIVLDKGRLSFQGVIDFAISKYIGGEKNTGFIDLKDYKPNFSDGTLKVNSIFSFDHNPSELLVYSRGQKIRMGVEVSVYSSVTCAFGFNVSNRINILFAALNEERPFRLEKDKKYLLCFEVENHLLSGQYVLHLGFNIGKETFWWGTDILCFDVVSPECTISSGFFDVQASFFMKESES